MSRHLSLTAGRQGQGPSTQAAFPLARASRLSWDWLGPAMKSRSWTAPTKGTDQTTLPNSPCAFSWYASTTRGSASHQNFSRPGRTDRGKLQGLALGVPAGGLALAVAQGVWVRSEGEEHGVLMRPRAHAGKKAPPERGFIHKMLV